VISTGIMGGAGYTGGELIRILLNHPHARIAFAQSRSQAGKPISSVHTDLKGVTNLTFVTTADFNATPVDALFLALPHGESRRFLSENPIPESTRIIDLSADFRLNKDSSLSARKFLYGLPELSSLEIRNSTSLANPGCFASALQFALLPLAKAKKLGPVSATGITGSTGAGVKPTETTHFSFRSNNIQAYKTLTHQHVGEVEESLSRASGMNESGKLSFIPWRGDFTRGIFVSAQLDTELTRSKALDLYRAFYEGAPFIQVTDESIDLKSVVNTNRVQIEVDQVGGKLVIHVAIDNLLKGASGQAVQNFNLMMGLPETSGLLLKGSAF
jgi:N-acetyl-gamma-glutamyl-phosphate reductase